MGGGCRALSAVHKPLQPPMSPTCDCGISVAAEMSQVGMYALFHISSSSKALTLQTSKLLANVRNGVNESDGKWMK